MSRLLKTAEGNRKVEHIRKDVTGNVKAPMKQNLINYTEMQSIMRMSHTIFG